MAPGANGRGTDRFVWHDELCSIRLESRCADALVTDEIVVAVLGRVHGSGSAGQPDSAARLLARRYLTGTGRFLDGLSGEYAGVVYDRRRRRPMIFRDLVGGRPMLYVQVGSQFIAGSLLRPLLDIAGIDAVPDERWAAQYLGWGAAPPNASQYRGVSRLLGGHCATPGSAGWVVERCDDWRLRRDRRSVDEDVAAFRQAFDQAVDRRLRDTDRVAVALSGGLDSTALLATARAVRPAIDMVALSIPFTAPEGDERDMQRRMAGRAEAELRWVSLEGYGPLGGEPARLIERFGAPPGPTNWFIGDALAAAALSAGAPVVMDGEDGDTLLNGSAHFLSDLMARGRLVRWLVEARGMRSIQASWRSILATSLLPLIPHPIQPPRYRASAPPTYLGPALVQHGPGPHDPWRPGFTFRHDERALLDDTVRAKLTYQTSDWFWDRDLGLSRPFMDRELIQLCATFPWDRKVSSGTYKLLLRRAMTERLPAELLALRTKANLSSAFVSAASGWERGWISEGLELAREDTSGWFDRDGVANLTRSMLDGPVTPWHARVALAAWWREWMKRRRR